MYGLIYGLMYDDGGSSVQERQKEWTKDLGLKCFIYISEVNLA